MTKHNATVHWYDNTSHEGMAKLADGTLVYITNSVMKYKPVLESGAKIIISGILDETTNLFNVLNEKYYGDCHGDQLAVYSDTKNNTVSIVRINGMSNFKYWVWVGCNIETGITNQGNLTRGFKNKAAAIKYAKKHGVNYEIK